MKALLEWLAKPFDEKWDEPVDDWWVTRLERRMYQRITEPVARRLLEVLYG